MARSTTAAPSPLAGDPSLRGLASWSVRSTLSPGPWSRALGPGLIAVVALLVAEVSASDTLFLAALLVLPPLAVGVLGRWGDTAAVAAAATLAAVAALVLTDTPEDHAIVAAIVAVAGALAVVAAVVRDASAVALARFRLLAAAGEVADASRPPEQTVDRLLGLLVPAFADVCSIDALVDGAQRTLGARAAVEDGEDGERALVRRLPGPAEAEAGTTSVIARGHPQLLDPFDVELLAARAADDEDARALRALAIRSALIVPLHARSRALGALSFGACGRRRFSRADLAFAGVLAGRVALALDNAGLTRELGDVERRLDAVVGALAEAVTVMDATGRTVFANRAAVELLRLPTAEALTLARPGEMTKRFAVFTEDGRPVDYADYPSSRLLAGAAQVEPVVVRNVVVATGEERWLVQKSTAIRGPDEEIEHVVNVIEDVTEVKRAELSQRLLASVSEALAESLDPGRTLQRVAEIAVPALADWCSVDLPAGGGRLDLVAVAATDPGRVGAARERRERAPLLRSGDDPVARVVRDGRTIAAERVVVVPLQAGAQTLGAITFGTPDAPKRLDDRDVELAEELGRRAGTAVLDARLNAERAQIADTLQQGLRPPELPPLPGWSAASLYRPAGELNEVGGDFYDLFEVPGGWMVIVGDVAGQGAEAATRTGLARYTLRTAGQLLGEPGAALEQLNRTLRAQGELVLCTAVCARLETRDGGAAGVTLSSAGHPLPLLVRDGRVSAVGALGTIAGVFDDEAWPQATVELEADDLLVLYTDGVLDTVGLEGRFGEARLTEEVAAGPADAPGMVAHLAARLDGFQRGRQRDDTAVLALQLRGRRTSRASADATGGGAAR